MIMKYTEGNDIQEKPIFAIENDDNSTSSQELLDEPTIIIESNGDMEYNASSDSIKKRGGLPKWSLAIMWFVATVVLVFGCYKVIRLYNYYYNIGVSISVSPKENIKKLDDMKAQNESSTVVFKTDSVLGVALNIYELYNVKAELTLVEPDTADHSVLMYTRTADYTAMGKYLGSLVVDGEQKRSDVSRLGYCAIAKGNMVIGISRFDDMCEHMALTSASLCLCPTANCPSVSSCMARWNAKPLHVPQTIAFASSRLLTPKPFGTSPMLCANMAMWMPYTLPVATRAVSIVLPTEPHTSRRKPQSIVRISTTL